MQRPRQNKSAVCLEWRTTVTGSWTKLAVSGIAKVLDCSRSHRVIEFGHVEGCDIDLCVILECLRVQKTLKD